MPRNISGCSENGGKNCGCARLCPTFRFCRRSLMASGGGHDTRFPPLTINLESFNLHNFIGVGFPNLLFGATLHVYRLRASSDYQPIRRSIFKEKVAFVELKHSVSAHIQVPLEAHGMGKKHPRLVVARWMPRSLPNRPRNILEPFWACESLRRETLQKNAPGDLKLISEAGSRGHFMYMLQGMLSRL